MSKQYDVSLSFEPLWYKYVRVIDNAGKTYEGRVMMVCRADENDNGEESIGIITNMDLKVGTELYRHEIASIEITK